MVNNSPGSNDMYRAGGSDMLRGAVRVLVLRGRPRPEAGDTRAGGARPAAARRRARRRQRYSAGLDLLTNSYDNMQRSLAH